MMLKVPELALDDEAAKNLADACQNVAKHYNVAVSAKSKDWCMLILTCGAIYRPRYVAAKKRIADEKEAKKNAHAKPAAPVSVPQNQ